jgi:hypothetical protein
MFAPERERGEGGRDVGVADLVLVPDLSCCAIESEKEGWEGWPGK